MKRGIQERGTEKRTTDLKKLVVRRSLGGVAYAIHDPHAPSPQGKDEGPMPRCLFLVCPQAPLNDFEGLGELLPWAQLPQDSCGGGSARRRLPAGQSYGVGVGSRIASGTHEADSLV